MFKYGIPQAGPLGLPKLMILQTCDSRIIRRYLLLSSLLRGTTNMASPRQALRACPKLMNLQACDTCITRQLKYCITPTRGTQVWSPLLRWLGGRPSGPAPRLMIPQVCFRTLKYGPAPPGELKYGTPILDGRVGSNLSFLLTPNQGDSSMASPAPGETKVWYLSLLLFFSFLTTSFLLLSSPLLSFISPICKISRH